MIAIDGSNMISKCDPCRRLQGLSGVGIEHLCFSWSLGGSKTRMEASSSKDTPSCNNGVLRIPFHFQRACHHQLLIFFLIFDLSAHNFFCLSSVFDPTGLCSRNTITFFFKRYLVTINVSWHD